MIGNSDLKDRNDSRKILLSLTVLFIILILSIIFMFPQFFEILSTSTSTGLGLKDSAVVSFFVSLVLVTVLAMVSGDGLLGEVQFVVVGFLLFFIVFWLMIAWVF
ncbi:uncharacterized protein METZ01_LOCUS302146 [marine metagenome]|uniref:Uncharacterized protein n=1 Tax=marine metagenome TaxID=408172 RepID=A0A382MPC8_9ZZZZ